MNFSLIGAGRLGKSLAFSLLHDDLGELRDLCNTTLASAHTATKRLGAGRPISSLTKLKDTDILWITVPDEHIAAIANTLAEQHILKPGTVVVHCSGVLSSAVLNPLTQLGCHTASLHPFKAFSLNQLDPNAFQGCYCALEGAPNAINTLSPLFKQLGAVLITIEPEKKAVYHAAAVIASNYLVTMAAISTKLLVEAGIDAAVAKRMIHQIMQSNLNNIEQAITPESALTGPIARGDTHTIKRHIKALNEASIRQLYATAALATLPLTQLEAAQQQEMRKLLRACQEINVTGP
ncbi:MAG: hypothetical protein A3F46_07100 [Legionellales bacterium RIFCSPHIGHO2_12_FULL_42_9]|nr:MAG: hypothetical protein A3F46_07100 [Legionellales bacterium RIFCSPHIGHO2_12_FULL_42_9]